MLDEHSRSFCIFMKFILPILGIQVRPGYLAKVISAVFVEAMPICVAGAGSIS